MAPPDPLSPWRHDHHFGQAQPRVGEGRTRIVVAITAAMMVVEIAAGLAFGSMALLADGLHMGSHAVALGIALLAYVYARRRAHDTRFSFGTGKVNALGGFTGALLLVVFAVGMAWESVDRFLHPVAIDFDQALVVATVGLLVNVACAFILNAGGAHGHHHGGAHAHGQAHEHDHNLRSAYLHVLADALTSFTAILALLAGKTLGWSWMDPLMGIVGSLLVANWSRGLLRSSGRVLLDHQAPRDLRERVRQAAEAGGASTVTDLHVWSVGPGLWAAEIVLVGDRAEGVDAVKARLPDDAGLVHVIVERHTRSATPARDPAAP